MIRVFVAEDNAIVRKGIIGFINQQPDLEIVGEAENGLVAMQLLKKGLKVDVLLTDLNMPHVNGVQLVQYLKEKGLNIVSIILTMHENRAFKEKALAAGVKGYLLKDGSMDDLINGIRKVFRGESVPGNQF